MEENYYSKLNKLFKMKTGLRHSIRIIKPYVEQIGPKIDGLAFLKQIELAGRVCYKSEHKITDESAPAFVAKLIKSGHEAMIEHAPSISLKFVCDRGVSHEIVRHRLFSFAQESTRYCNYSKDAEVTFIIPCFWAGEDNISEFINSNKYEQFKLWYQLMLNAQSAYLSLIFAGASPQEARSVLPNSLKTEIIVTGNIRQWRHFFRLRTVKSAHPQMQEVANMALELLREQIPVVFDDI